MQIILGILLVVVLILITIITCILNAYIDEIKRKERLNNEKNN